MIPLSVIFPELVLIVAASVLFLMGVSNKISVRRAVPVIALLALAFVFLYQFPEGTTLNDPTNTFKVDGLAHYIKLIAAGVSVMFVLLAWPTNHSATANSSVSYGHEAGEFFGLMLLSITGIFLVAGANDIMLLFLGIELASLPTYIMVSVSRPLPAAQEAGVKYFFLGALSAALLLFGLSYLYGTTGLTNISQLTERFAGTLDMASTHATVALTPWQMLAAIMVIMGLAFKLAAVPLHFYAADVYQGAATPVTALLSFVPKTSGFVALIKILYIFGGSNYALPPELVRLMWIIAVLTMTVGNVLGLLQSNIKRVLAYSSIAHSGYMLTAVTVMVSATGRLTDRGIIQNGALAGILFYLAAYGIMNAGTFGVLMLLPAKLTRKFGEAPLPHSEELPPQGSETFDDIAGQGRKHIALGLAMAVGCFSLIGLPFTVGFFGKVYLIAPALKEGLIWLVVFTMVNAAISAFYYLKIVGSLFLRTEAGPIGQESQPEIVIHSFPATLAVVLSTAATLFFGIVLPATQELANRATNAAAQERIMGHDSTASAAKADVVVLP